MIRAFIALITLALGACVTDTLTDDVPLDTPSKRIVAASAQIQAIAVVSTALTESGVLNAEQSLAIADALQEAQNALVLLDSLELDNANEETLDPLIAAEKATATALELLNLFTSRSDTNISYGGRGCYGGGIFSQQKVV